MTTIIRIEADANNRVIYGNNVAWATARSTASSMEATTVDSHTAGSLNGYYNWRSAYKFNTNIGLPLESIVSAKLQVAITTQHTSADTGDYLKVCNANWSAFDPVTSGNMESVYDAIIAGTPVATIFGLNGAAVGTLLLSEELDKTWLNLSSFTYYGVIGSRDYNNVAPTGDARWYIGAVANATPEYRPQLVLEVIPSSIKKLTGVTYANLKKVIGITTANAKKVAGV